ncbi:DUF5133 domain-containing protein [Streptomyces sp. NPDC058662]|uniref:DUF5133 domain-containing protein n=1 Tax=Streptomyces sp. NPDC058662 TaxID=3346583 RepID=UPI00365AFAD6
MFPPPAAEPAAEPAPAPAAATAPSVSGATSVSGAPASGTPASGAPASCPPDEAVDAPVTAQALGMIMALTPCTAREARTVLTAASETAGVTPMAVALALVDGSRGGVVPSGVERGLRLAIGAARVSPASPVRGLLPCPERTADALARFRECRRRVRETPWDEGARSELDDAAYTLCVLMARRTVHEAVLAAMRHLAERR